jgi:hypothetical protein
VLLGTCTLYSASCKLWLMSAGPLDPDEDDVETKIELELELELGIPDGTWPANTVDRKADLLVFYSLLAAAHQSSLGSEGSRSWTRAMRFTL